ncbi:MAG TPA: sugar transferase [Bryobacteraceae bacterium]|jgi:lipopolysaccharide/colanic/teichoic acid biosynthesis glycosyltransferase
MKASLHRGNEYAAALSDLFACMAGFGVATWAARAWLGEAAFAPWGFQWAFSTVIAWLAIVFPESSSHGGVSRWIDGFFIATGSNLLVQYGLTYLFGSPAAPWFLIVLGSALSLAAAGLLREALLVATGGRRGGILLVGFDSSTASLAAALEGDSVGVLENGPPPVSEGLLFLGPPDRLDEVCATKHPRAVVMSGMPAGISLAHLLRLHYAGIEVEGAPFLCEGVLRRVAWQHLSPSDLLFSVTPVTSRAMLAFQAIYKNLVGLGLLIVFAPVLILVSLLIMISTGEAAMEQIECSGLQRIPFQMFRFRTTRLSGAPCWIGNLIGRLHLANLPQLINVFRGEMTLFGPRPVRRAFVERLLHLMPAYVYRFTVKPGIFGWSQTHFAETGGVPEEALSLEYDFYYIRQESPSLDLDILFRTLFRRSKAARKKAAVTDTASGS